MASVHAPDPDDLGDEQTIEKTIVDNLSDGVYYVDSGRRITYWNNGAARMTGYSSADVVGHRCFDNLLGHVDAAGTPLCHTACPLAATILDGKSREASVWLRHREGHRAHVLVRTMPVRDRSGATVGAVETFSDNSAVLSALEAADEARRDSLTDPLTGLPNRRHFETALRASLENLKRYDWRFGLLLMDIDHFKDVNDSFGHSGGDSVLTVVAHTVRDAIRAGDVAARWGGDEFAVLVATPEGSGLADVAERIRVLMERSDVRVGKVRRAIFVSIGGTEARPGETPETLFARADEALYRAKNTGRRRVEIDGTGASEPATTCARPADRRAATDPHSPRVTRSPSPDAGKGRFRSSLVSRQGFEP
jgi:diguanylate cyclase (GGDEF)-like protein/PAS domain S-box-containing protein